MASPPRKQTRRSSSSDKGTIGCCQGSGSCFGGGLHGGMARGLSFCFNCSFRRKRLVPTLENGILKGGGGGAVATRASFSRCGKPYGPGICRQKISSFGRLHSKLAETKPAAKQATGRRRSCRSDSCVHARQRDRGQGSGWPADKGQRAAKGKWTRRERCARPGQAQNSHHLLWERETRDHSRQREKIR